jgi:tRNA (guanine6-N2)-methyltransferase
MRSNSSSARNIVVMYLLCFTGLADVVRREFDYQKIEGQFIDQKTLQNHDLLVWKGTVDSVAKFRKLRTVEDIFYSVSEKPFHVSKIGDLKKNCRIGVETFRQMVFKSIEIKSILFGKTSTKKSIRYISFVKQNVDHGMARKAVGQYLNGFFSDAFPRWKCEDPADMECWGFWVNDLLLIGIRVTSSSFRSRCYRQEERQGSLRPTIAAAMAILSKPTPNDKVIDPMCGTGTLLIERGLMTSYLSMTGYDIDSHAIRLAVSNVTTSKLKGIDIDCGDASNLPLESQSFNCLISNLPFGKIYGSQQTNLDLYYRSLKEWSRLIEPSGRAVLLTSDTKSMNQVLNKLSKLWNVERKLRFKILGTWADCFVLSRL